MANRIFLRIGAWYKATDKQLSSDIEITGLIDDPDALYPESDEITEGGGGGSVTIPATGYDTNAEALSALGAGVLYKSTTLINGSPIILITVPV